MRCSLDEGWIIESPAGASKAAAGTDILLYLDHFFCVCVCVCVLVDYLVCVNWHSSYVTIWPVCLFQPQRLLESFCNLHQASAKEHACLCRNTRDVSVWTLITHGNRELFIGRKNIKTLALEKKFTKHASSTLSKLSELKVSQILRWKLIK